MGKAFYYIWGTVAVLLLWWVLAACLNSAALPDPIQAISALAANFQGIVPEFWVSLCRILLAMFAGSLLGVPLGLILGRSARADIFLSPIMYILYPLPKVVLLPILFVLLGIGGESKVALITIAIFFQMVITMRDAAHAVPRESIEAVVSLGASRLQAFVAVVIPETLPAFFTALRVSTGTAVAILFIAESMAGSSGLGYFIMHSWSVLEYSKMFAGILAIAFMGILLYDLFDLAEKHLTVKVR